MTKKDYELIGEAVKRTYQMSGVDKTSVDMVQFHLIQAFKKAHPKFNDAKFMMSCGVTV